MKTYDDMIRYCRKYDLVFYILLIVIGGILMVLLHMGFFG